MTASPWLIRPLPAWTDPPTRHRRSANVFKASWDDTLKLLLDEIDKLGGQTPIVLQLVCNENDLRADGMLRARSYVGHPGVVVSFEAKNLGPLRYATDAYERQWSGGLTSWQANVRAIALTLEALRSIDRWGVTKRGEQYTGWKALPATASTFATADEALQWMRDYTEEHTLVINAGGLTASQLYRGMAKRMHPDNGGPRADWDRLDEARRLLDKAGML